MREERENGINIYIYIYKSMNDIQKATVTLYIYKTIVSFVFKIIVKYMTIFSWMKMHD